MDQKQDKQEVIDPLFAIQKQEAQSILQKPSSQDQYTIKYNHFFQHVKAEPISEIYQILKTGQIHVSYQQQKNNQNIFQILQIKSQVVQNIFKIKIRLGQFYFNFLVLYQPQKSCCHAYQLFAFGSFGKLYKFRTDKQVNQHYIVKCLTQKDQSFDQFFIQSIRQYTFCYLMSYLKVGPHMEKNFGFDLILFEDCIQFTMEQCRKVQYQENLLLNLKKSLKMMHNLQIVHIDIKPQNVMYSQFYKKHVFIDFGLTRKIKQKIGEQTKTIFSGTFLYSGKQMKKVLGKTGLVNLYYNDVHCLIQSISQLKKRKQSDSKKKKAIQIKKRQQNQIYLINKELYVFKYRIAEKNIEKHFMSQQFLEVQKIFDNFLLLNQFHTQIIILLVKIQISFIFKKFLFKIASNYFNVNFFQLKQKVIGSNLNAYEQAIKNCSLNRFSVITQGKTINDYLFRDYKNIKKYLFDKDYIKLINKQKYYHLFIEFVNFLKNEMKSSLKDKIQATQVFLQLNEVKNINLAKVNFDVQYQKIILECHIFLLKYCQCQSASSSFKQQNYKSLICQTLFLSRAMNIVQQNRLQKISSIIQTAFNIYSSFYDILLLSLQIYSVQNMFNFTIRAEKQLTIQNAINMLFLVRFKQAQKRKFYNKNKKNQDSLTQIQVSFDLIRRVFQFNQACPNYKLSFKQCKSLKDQISQQIRFSHFISKDLKQFTIKMLNSYFLEYISSINYQIQYQTISQIVLSLFSQRQLKVYNFMTVPLFFGSIFQLGSKSIQKIDKIINCSDISQLFFKKQRTSILLELQMKKKQGIRSLMQIVQNSQKFDCLFFLLNMDVRIHHKSFLKFSLQTDDKIQEIMSLIKDFDNKLIKKVIHMLKTQRNIIQEQQQANTQINQINRTCDSLLTVLQNNYLQLILLANKSIMPSNQSQDYFYQVLQKQFDPVFLYLKKRHFLGQNQQRKISKHFEQIKCKRYLSKKRYKQLLNYCLQNNISDEQDNYIIIQDFIFAFNSYYFKQQNLYGSLNQMQKNCYQLQYKKILKRIYQKLKVNKQFKFLLHNTSFLFYIFQYLIRYQSLKQILSLVQDFCMWISLNPWSESVKYLTINFINFFQGFHLINLQFQVLKILTEYNKQRRINKYINPYWFMICGILFCLKQNSIQAYYKQIMPILKNIIISIGLINKVGKDIILQTLYGTFAIIKKLQMNMTQGNDLSTNHNIFISKEEIEVKQEELQFKISRKVKYLQKRQLKYSKTQCSLQMILKTKLKLSKKQKYQIFVNFNDQKLIYNVNFFNLLITKIVRYHKVIDNVQPRSIRKVKIFDQQ